MKKIKLIKFLETNEILDRLELEARNVGMSQNELWGRVSLDFRTINTWRTETHTPTLASLQHVQEVINQYIREKNPDAEFEYVI